MVIDRDQVAKIKLAKCFLGVFVSDSHAHKNFPLYAIRAGFNILSHPLKYIMYYITENEAPPPNVPFSEPPHQLSKSLLKYPK